MYNNTISQRYNAAFAIMKQSFVKIWGLSLLTEVIACLVLVLGWGTLIIAIPIALAISAGMSAIYLKAIRGEEYKSANIFDAFKDFATAKRVICGLLWMELWILLWALIPIAGFVFAIIKSLEYSFTPYILMTNPELGPMEALNESKKLTKGLKGRMFGALIIPVAIYCGAVLILTVFSLIPFIGLIFGFILFLVEIAFVIFAPLLFGLLFAGFYDGVINPAPIPPQQQYQQPYPQQQYYQPAPQQGQYYQPAPQPYPVQPTAPAAPDDLAPTAPVAPQPAPEPAPEEPEFDKTVQIDRPVDLPETPETEAQQ